MTDGKYLRRHGHSKPATPTYLSWSAAKNRCRNPRNPKYPDYGGRGIRICDRWLKFDNFLADMGVMPKGMTLDRKDVNGHYEPSNCRWATRAEQNRNLRARRRHRDTPSRDPQTEVLGALSMAS